MAALTGLENFYSEPGKVSVEDIDALERELGIKVPAAYKQFLLAHSFAEWFGHTILGICDEEECDAISYTKEARAVDLPSPRHRRIPQEGIVVARYHGGGYYVLFSENSDRAGQVALFAHEALGGEVQRWNSFEDFLKYKISVST